MKGEKCWPMLKRVGPSNSAFSCGVEAEGEGVENAVAPVQKIDLDRLMCGRTPRNVKRLGFHPNKNVPTSIARTATIISPFPNQWKFRKATKEART